MTTPAASPRKRKSKPTLPKLIGKYYADLGHLAHQNVMYEMGNRSDDSKYIVRLVKQVIRVRVETVKIVKALPGAFA